MKSKRLIYICVPLALCGTTLIYFIFHLIGIGCPIKFLTGISCPGCGMTRALVSALRLDFRQAFSYHPLWIAVLPTAALLTILKLKYKNKVFFAVLGAFVLALLVVYICRLRLSCDSTVVFEPENGFVYRLITE